MKALLLVKYENSKILHAKMLNIVKHCVNFCKSQVFSHEKRLNFAHEIFQKGK